MGNTLWLIFLIQGLLNGLFIVALLRQGNTIHALLNLTAVQTSALNSIMQHDMIQARATLRSGVSN